MVQASTKRVVLGTEVWIAMLLLLGLYVLPPVLFGTQLLYGSPATPIWVLSVQTGSLLGCRTLLCAPMYLGMFTVYTYLLAIIVGAIFRVSWKYIGME